MSGVADIWAVIPVKETVAAKARLAEAMPRHLRSGFALAMLQDVLESVVQARGLAGIAIVTVDAAARELALRFGCRILTVEARGGHTAAVAAAARTRADEGRTGMLQRPGDIPLVRADEISLLVALRRAAPSLTIVPSHDDLGSNAVLVCPPTAVPLSFGDDSFYPHLRAAQARGVKPLIVRQHGISLDIDRPEDIAALARSSTLTYTQAFLERHGLTPRADGAVA